MIIDPYTWHSLPIRHIAKVADDTVSVRVDKPAGYIYRSGQYAVLRVEVDGTPLLRQFSLVSYPGNDFLELLVQREPRGAVSNWFHTAATPGTLLEISQPFGAFTLDDVQSPLLFIAGRVGIAPFISMIRDELSHERGQNITLLYSARGERQFCYPELLGSINTTFFDTESASRINAAVLTQHLSPATHVYLCGSKQFVDSLMDTLLELGVTPERMKRELFTLQ